MAANVARTKMSASRRRMFSSLREKPVEDRRRAESFGGVHGGIGGDRGLRPAEGLVEPPAFASGERVGHEKVGELADRARERRRVEPRDLDAHANCGITRSRNAASASKS